MSEMWAMLRDPRVSTTLVLNAVVVAGFALVGQGYRGAAALLYVPFQVPYLVSGAVAGLALVGVGLALLDVHLNRAEAAQERRDVAALQRDVLRLLAVAPQVRERRERKSSDPETRLRVYRLPDPPVDAALRASATSDSPARAEEEPVSPARAAVARRRRWASCTFEQSSSDGAM